MPFDQTTRNKLQRFVSESRKLLSEEFTRQMQNEYGLDPVSGNVSPVDKLPHLDDSRYETALILRDTLEHYTSHSEKKDNKEALNRIVREQAFTVLNRLCAIRMAEARGIIIESISNGVNSKGFDLYIRLAGTSLGERGDAYKCYLFSLFDELATDLAVLFDRYSPTGRLFPKEKTLLELIDKINDLEISELWSEDEAIGWIYQYFNSKEERQQMRSESQAPRNSRELAVRNQFFTPRYVVEFLTDNTLGRIWYEMNQSNTTIKDFCKYLVRRPNEIFLEENKEAPEQEETTENLSQEELLKQPVYIPYRNLKDPRDIKMLDPACGSMHFGLYAFDLFEKIYEEAWEIETNRGANIFSRESNQKPLTESYSDKEAFIRDIPRLIIENNIHGIDIDPRATQIAGLSLWLRAHRTWKEQNVKLADRPQIQKSNIVCAEPMPGEEDLLRSFTEKVKPTVLGQLVEVIFDKMKLAGEAGSLLKIEEEIQEAIDLAREEFNKAIAKKEAPKQQKLFGEMVEPEQKSLFDFDDLPTKTEFWATAEEQILKALKNYAELAENGDSTKRRLFAKDAAKGFAFIDLCRKRYDVVLMNPPFGDASKNTINYCKSNYETWNKNLLCAFIIRVRELETKNGFTGAIFDRTAAIKSSYEKFRIENLDPYIQLVADTGWEVLDANVETTVHILSKSVNKEYGYFFDIRDIHKNEKEYTLFELIEKFNNAFESAKTYIVKPKTFIKFPNASIIYDLPLPLLSSFSTYKNLLEKGFCIFTGHQIQSERHFKLFWEIEKKHKLGQNEKFCYLYNGGAFSRYIMPFREVALFGKYSQLGSDNFPSYSYRIQNKDKHFNKGVGFGKRDEIIDAHLIPPNFLFTVEGQVCPIENKLDQFEILAFLNSSSVSRLLNTYTGQHKYSGYVNLLPLPKLDKNQLEIVKNNIQLILNLKLKYFSYDESCFFYRQPIWSQNLTDNLVNLSRTEFIKLEKNINQIQTKHLEIENLIISLYSKEVESAHNDLKNYLEISPAESIISWEFISFNEFAKFFAEDVISFLLGSSFGRWDIRYATGEKESPACLDPFESLPVCPPGMLQNDDGLPVEPQDVPDDYPVDIPWDGILVDDPGHEKDIIARVRKTIEVIWQDKAEEIEQEACQILGVNSLREYFSKPASFFADHLKRYSKSRRQAPIYWPLSTESGSYTLWVYYHRLNDQTLYTCVNNFVEPKIREITSQVDKLRSSTKRSPQEEKEFEKLSTLEAELKDFKEELLRIALFWKPNLNDGVQITAAPLYKLFKLSAWSNKLKDTWQQLEKGDYDWAHLAYSIWPERVIKASLKDRSLAIAHDLEDDLWEEVVDKKDKKGNVIKMKWVPKKISETALNNYISEKTKEVKREMVKG
jgi:hypothetical protein